MHVNVRVKKYRVAELCGEAELSEMLKEDTSFVSAAVP